LSELLLALPLIRVVLGAEVLVVLCLSDLLRLLQVHGEVSLWWGGCSGGVRLHLLNVVKLVLIGLLELHLLLLKWSLVLLYFARLTFMELLLRRVRAATQLALIPVFD
jgi:hypothetical protein